MISTYLKRSFKLNHSFQPTNLILNQIQRNLFNTKILSVNEIKQYLDENKVKVSHNVIPILSFDDLPVDKKIKNALKDKFEKPTPVQAVSFPLTLSGKNIVGVSVTGSGKTLAFGIPLIQHILNNKKKMKPKSPIAMVISPTRELARQIFEEISSFAKKVGLRGSLLIGMTSNYAISRELSHPNFSFVVTTTGKVNNLIEKKRISLENVSLCVLDEADYILGTDMFEVLSKISENIKNDCIKTMWSATFNKRINEIKEKFAKKSSLVKVGKGELGLSTNNDHIFHKFFISNKLNILYDILNSNKHKNKKTFVFFNSIVSLNKCYEAYMKIMQEKPKIIEKRDAFLLCSKIDSVERISVMNEFKSKKNVVLFATNIAARGIDVKDADLVVNFDCPFDVETFVHRVGRTGRIPGKKGTSITLLSQFDVMFSNSIGRNILDYLKKDKDEVKNYEFESTNIQYLKSPSESYNNRDNKRI